MTRKKRFLIVPILLLLLLVGWYVIGCAPLERCPFFRFKKPLPEKVILSFIGPWDSEKDWKGIASKFKEYKEKEENGYLDVTIKYEKIDDYINYENVVREKQFEGDGPNIFMVFNSWIPRYQDKILPMPPDMMSLGQFESAFAKVARDDLIMPDGKIYALPFYIDTLALYYNEDMLFNESYPGAPKSWDEFRDYAEKLTRRDKNGDITRAGAAFGGGSNINRSQDIIMLLIMQNNISANKEKLVIFNKAGNENAETAAAIKFYTDFTDPQKRFYGWNENQAYSIDAFTERKAAMMIDYSYHIENIINKTSGTLNFKIAPIPQLDSNNALNYASYWVPVVAKKSPCRAESGTNIDCNKLAWEFLNFAARKENVKSYLDSVKKPAANLSLAKEQASNFDDMRSVFASQVFTAKSWYHPEDSESDKVLESMINSIITTNENNKETIFDAMETARVRYKWLN